MIRLPYNCAHFTCQQGNAQNLSCEASTVCEPRTSSCTSWIQKRQRNQRSNCQHLLDHRQSKRIPEKHLLFFTDYTKAFACVDDNKVWEILQEMELPDHFTCLLRNLRAGQVATVKQSSPSITSSQSLLKLMSIKLVMPSNHLILSSPSPPVFSLFQHQGLFK